MLYFQPNCTGRYANAAQEYAVTLYLNLAELLGANPANCLVYEDTRIGIQAGKAASMTTLLVDQGALCPR